MAISAIPIEQHGFAFHKTDFTDTLCLCYSWYPSHLPSHCVCRKAFSVSHAFSCPHGTFPILRQNDVRDLTAKLMSEVCHGVQVEPHLQLLSGESLHYKSAVHEDDARVDIRAAGFWNCRRRDHRSFLMLECLMLLLRATSLLVQQQLFEDMHEGKKRRAYEEHMREVERAVLLLLCSLLQGAWEKLLQ